MKMKPTITVADNGNLQIHIPMLIRRMRGRKTVIAPQALDGDIPGAQESVQSAVLQALGRAFSWADILESGQIRSISELARTLDVDGSYVARILKLTTLAPDIVEALINGEEPNPTNTHPFNHPPGRLFDLFRTVAGNRSVPPLECVADAAHPSSRPTANPAGLWRKRVYCLSY